MRKLLILLLLAGSPLTAQGASAPNIVVLGDSLAAAYGMDRGAGWVALLRQRLQDQGYPHNVVNASISGDTTAGGLRRLPQILQRHEPAFVIVELGANDGLRAGSLKSMRENLREIIRRSRTAGAQVLLLGMRIPSNYGADYAEAFHAVYTDLAAAQRVTLIKFFLAPIAMDRSYFQPDGLHPTARAQPLILDTVWRALKNLISPAKANRGQAPLVQPVCRSSCSQRANVSSSSCSARFKRWLAA